MKQGLYAIAMLCAAVPVACGANGDPWYYTIGETKIGQQANYCLDREDVLRIAGVFSEQGPRPGFAALQGAPHCARKVQPVTPMAVIEAVTVEAADSTYTINFVEARVEGGRTEYLVTTRDVRDAD